MNELRVPGRGSIFLGIAAAAFATGPCMLALIGIADLFDGADQASRWERTLAIVPRLLIFASFICLVGSVPAACLNAYLLSRAARNDMDAIWFSMLSGGLIGGLVLVVLDGIFGGSRAGNSIAIFSIAALFIVTGACMGLLHWVIAIRPRRRWRRRLENDEEAIRAME